MTKEIENVELLGHIATHCPYCTKTIFLPKYRLIPLTESEVRHRNRERLDREKEQRKQPKRRDRDEQGRNR